MRKATVTSGGGTWGTVRPGPIAAGTPELLATRFNIHADLERTMERPQHD